VTGGFRAFVINKHLSHHCEQKSTAGNFQVLVADGRIVNMLQELQDKRHRRNLFKYSLVSETGEIKSDLIHV